jgi:hypothetical protein
MGCRIVKLRTQNLELGTVEVAFGDISLEDAGQAGHNCSKF